MEPLSQDSGGVSDRLVEFVRLANDEQPFIGSTKVPA